MRVSIVFFGVLAAPSALLGTAQADDSALRLMRESIPYTDVIDAADGDDPFDLNAHVGFTRTTDRGTIQREYTDSNGDRKRSSVADSERLTSALMFGLDIGLFHDLMASVRLPLILSDARTLSLPSGKSVNDVDRRLSDPKDAGNVNGPLFSVPFESPTRAGFDYIGLGATWGILNQQREPYFPTWILSLEGRRAIGAPLKPCGQFNGDTICGSLTDTGTGKEFSNKSAGSSRGLSGVMVETRASYRYRYLEPYMGLSYLVEWASTAKKYFNPTGDLEGAVNTLPSRTTVATLGTALVPWENRARFQRFALDLRLTGTYLSEGHDYSALYDALGTSTHAALSTPNREGFPDGEPFGAKVPFYGLTDIQARLKYGMRVGLEMQAAQYVRFSFGTALNWLTAYAMTSADACNTSVSSSTSRSYGLGGSKCDDGIINPAQRATIDSPGRRFWMTEQFIVDIYANATAQF